MRWRLSLVLAVLCLAASACHLDPAKSCSSNTDCGPDARCDGTTSTCVTVVCDPACGFEQYCDQTSASCKAAHTAVEVTSPAAGATVGGQVRVHAQLTPAQQAAHEDSTQLTLTATNDAVGGTPETIALHQVDGGDGQYEGIWPPMHEGPYRLTVADVNLTSPEVDVTADLSGPKFQVSVAPHGLRQGSGTTSYSDSAMPNAYRRDEWATVEVRSADTDVDPTSVRVSVMGTGGAAVDAGVVTAMTSGCSTAFCGSVSVDLAQPQMNAFHTQFTASATGTDVVGNAGTTETPASIDVTRFKWVFTTPDGRDIHAAPAVAADGTLYVGTSNGASTNPQGELFSVDQTGGLQISEPARGALTGSVAVGATDAGSNVYMVALADDAGTALVARKPDGGEIACQLATTSLETTPALSMTTAGGIASETFSAVMDFGASARIEGLRLSDGSSCAWLGTSQSSLPANLVESGGTFFYALPAQQAVDAVEFSDGWRNEHLLTASSGPGSLALFGVNLVYSFASSSGVGGMLIDGGTNWLSSSSGSTFAPTVEDQTGTVVVGTNTGVGLTAIGSAQGVQTTSNGGLGSSQDVLLGNGGTVYAAGNGSLTAFGGTGPSLLWSTSDAGVHLVRDSSFTTALNIDCARDAGVPVARPGILYVPVSTHSVMAVIVDSHGIDTTAPWPKYQHDPRNTGNADTPMSEFQCP